jgi:DNA-binding LacI/PurR family transcriptional regulator
MTSIKKVAAAAGVSVGTVSNVLNRPDRVSAETRARVRVAIDELGFVRNESARQLRAGQSNTLALVVLDTGNPFFTDVARGAEAEAVDQLVFVCNSQDDGARERRYLQMLEEQRVQGILITPVGDGPHDQLDRLVRRGTPVVLVDHRAANGEQCSVAVDDVLGGRLAAEHLLSLGHRGIVYLGGPFALRQVRERHQGALEMTTAAGAELTALHCPALTVEQGRASGDQLADLLAGRGTDRPGGPAPTAVFCANDLLSLGVLQAMTARGVRVPQDLAIIGYDDIGYAASAAIPLSSVRQPREQLGRTATQLLLDEIADLPNHRHRQVVFDPELVIRESTAGRRPLH